MFPCLLFQYPPPLLPKVSPFIIPRLELSNLNFFIFIINNFKASTTTTTSRFFQAPECLSRAEDQQSNSKYTLSQIHVRNFFPHFKSDLLNAGAEGYCGTWSQCAIGRTPQGEGSASRRDLHLTKHDIHRRQTSTYPVRFEPAIPAIEWPQTYALDRAATGTVWDQIFNQNR